MRELFRVVLQSLALVLTPGVALAFTVVTLSAALGTWPALIVALTSVPLWAQAYLVLAGVSAVLTPVVVLASLDARSRERDEALSI
jgi:hypothetical protein